MPKRKAKCKPACLSGQCDLDHGSFAVAISDITPDGCSAEVAAEASGKWEGDLDFLHLTIADRIEVNGKVLWQKGKRASIRFFGQIHPVVVKELDKAAA